jgi:integrase
MKEADQPIKVTFGGACVTIRRRANGWYSLRWREAGKDRSTTRVDFSAAQETARRKVRELANGQGARMLTIEDGNLVRRLKALSGTRSPHAVLDMLEDLAGQAGGLDVLARAVRFWDQSGMAAVQRVPMARAREMFLDHYDGRDYRTRKTLQTELDAWCKQYGEMTVCDLTAGLLSAWVARPLPDGQPVAARTHNNRLNVWRTFLNKARAWNLWPRAEKHPAELLERRREADRIPQIFTVAQVERLLAAVREESPALMNYLVIGCWLGLRPAEIQRLTLDAWDWERGYVEITAEVAAKVMQHRFVPITDNVRRLLGGRIVDPRTRKHLRGGVRGLCCANDDANQLSLLARKIGIVEDWPADVMRHSYISYRLAQGHGRGQVAEWAGNSESEIRRSYRRPLRKEDGEAWFSVGLGG